MVKKAAAKAAPKKKPIAPAVQPGEGVSVLEAMQKNLKSLGARNATVATLLPPPEIATTGFPILDDILGGGIRRGIIYEFYGEEQSAKSLLMRCLVASLQKQFKDKYVIYFCSEHDLDLNLFIKAGCDVDRIITITDNDAVKAFAMINGILQRQGKDILAVILDSIGNLNSESQVIDADRGEISTTQPAELSRNIGKPVSNFSKLIHDFNVFGIFTNQVTNVIGGYGDPITTPGGNKYKHNRQASIKLGRVSWLPDNDAIVRQGIEVRVEAKKNKPGTSKIRKTDEKNHLKIYFEEHNKKAERYLLWDAAVEAGVVEKRNSWYHCLADDEAQTTFAKYNGETNFIDALFNDQEFYTRLKEEVGKRNPGVPTEVADKPAKTRRASAAKD